jgi:hypothetical protein
MQAGVCPAYASCCFTEYLKVNNKWGDGQTRNPDVDCPGALEAAKLTTCP